METKIKTLGELNPGDVVLIDTPFISDGVGSVLCVLDTNKYSIESGGRKCRTIEIPGTNQLKFEYADEVGETGDEQVKEYTIILNDGGSFSTWDDNDVQNWNVRKIDSVHPKYDYKANEFGKEFSSMMDIFKSIYE